MVPSRDAAGHLEIEETVADPVSAQHLPYDMNQRRATHRPAYRKLMQRSPEAIEMPIQVDDEPVPDLADLVDTVGKLIAPILDVNGGLGVPDISAVDIGDSRHG